MRKLLTTALIAVLAHLSAWSQCTSLKLSVDKQVQCAPGIVNYKVTGAPVGSAYMWDFGSGFVANTDTVYEFYLKPQVIDVSVKVTFPNGSNCLITEKAIARIMDKPKLSYEISREKLCDGPDTITLINTTPRTKEISWIVDGTNYFNANDTLVHRFKTIGSKNINLVVTDSFGCRNVEEFKDVAVVYPDVDIDFVADNTSGCITKKVQFTPEIGEHGQNITSYAWSFEGANIKGSNSLKPPQLRYVTAGKFDVSLSLETDKGCKHELVKKDYLQFGDSMNIQLELKDSVLCLADSTTISVKNPVDGKYTWLFSGSADTTMISGSEVGLKYPNAGDFDVTLLLNYAGCFSSVSLPSAIHVKSVKANFNSVNNYHCYTPHVTNITNLSSSYNSSNLTYQWSVYDAAGKLQSRSGKKDFSFSSPDWGRYKVELIARDGYGCVDTMSSQQFIRVDSIRPAFDSDERIGCVDQEITLRSITPASSYMSTDSFYWVVYDLDDSTIYNQGKGREIKQSFSKPGYYDVKLFAGNLIGCIDTLEINDFIHIIEPSKGFEVMDSLVCKGKEVTFEATTTPKFAPFLHSYELTNSISADYEYLEPDTARTRAVELKSPGPYDVKYRHQINKGCIDSIERKDFVHINGIKGTIELDERDGCMPLVVKPRFKASLNYHFGNENDSIITSWSAVPGGVNKNKKILSSGKNTNEPTFTFMEKGIYTIYVTAYNSSGCAYSIGSIPISVGVSADFELERDKWCAGDTAWIKNTSSLSPTKYQWDVFSNSGYSIQGYSSPAKLVPFVPKGNDHYDIRLIASKKGECFDTITKSVESIIVRSNFEMVDTLLHCAPAYAQFNTLSENADTFFWSFGDGSTITSTDTFIANIYRRNSGYSRGFDVTLVSKSYLGCTDTLTIESAVKVFGPVPKFSISNPVGCEPHVVRFTNESEDVKEFFLNFDDNTNLDSTLFESHTYRVQTTGMSQRYIPSVYVRDSLGCAAVFESPDTVVVLKSPKSIPMDQEIEGCSPVRVALNDESQKIISRKWLLNGKEFSGEKFINPSISESGTHKIELIVSNLNQCYDTSTFDITVHENPTVHFNLLDLSCLGEPVRLNGESTGNPIDKWIWTMDASESDTTWTPNHGLTFNEPGKHLLSLNGIDKNGCIGQFDTTILIRSANDIPEGEIKYVTINDQDEIEVHWTPINPEFISHTTLRDNGTMEVLFQGGVNQQSMVAINGRNLAQSHCFELFHTDLCGDEGTKSIVHCPIILDVQKGKPFELVLNWTAYNGWASVDSYVIMRSSNGKPFEKIGEVSGDVYTFTDQLLCDQDYTYCIEGRYNDLFTRSNKDLNRPEYMRNEIPMDIRVATVENNSHVSVNWNHTNFAYSTSYILRKYDAYGNSLLETIELNDSIYVDEEVDVNSENFMYTIQTVDHCGVSGVQGYEGLPMILTGHYLEGNSQLSWTPYGRWSDGVDYYQVQIRFDDGFRTIATVPGSQTAFVDKELHEDIYGEYVYQIVAVSFNSNVTSTSNQIELSGESVVWIPNAFSPNDDDHNPVFRPTPQFVYLVKNGSYRDYEMKIYNRWGELIFKTEDIKEGWDGTYMGKDCQMESYMYQIRVTGLDRTVYDKKGLVRLMR